MTNTKNTVPLYAEEQIINEEQSSIQEILSQFKQPIPSNFLKLEDLKHMRSTQGWKEPMCERYSCLINGEWKQIDIRHTLLEKLELSKDIPCHVYLSPTVLNKGLDNYFAYNVKNEEEIFIQKPFTINNLGQNLTKLFRQIKNLEEQEQSSQETIEVLKKEKEELEKLKSIWRNKYLEEKGSNNQELQAQITELIRERNNIQQELTNQQTEIANLQNEITQLNNNLQTTQQARDRIQQNLKKNLIGFLLKNKQKIKRIRELSESLTFLRGLLANKNQEATNLTNERDNLQTQINDLNQQLNNANALITNIQNLLGVNNLNNLPILPEGETLTSLLARPTPAQLNDLKRQNDILQQERNNLQTQRDNRPNITLSQWNNDYRNRPTQQQLTNLQSELNSIRAKLSNAEKERNNYRNQWNNHTCYCSREHCEQGKCFQWCWNCDGHPSGRD